MGAAVLVKQRLAEQFEPFRESLQELLSLKRDWGISDAKTLEDWVNFIDVPLRSAPMTKREVGKWRPKPLRPKRHGGQLG